MRLITRYGLLRCVKSFLTVRFETDSQNMRPLLLPNESIHKSHAILASLVPTAESDRLIQLLVGLINARKEYDPAAADHGRTSIYQMLLGLIEYISQIVPTRPDLVHPLRDLLYGLKGLDAGSVAPMLTPVEVSGRRVHPIPQELFRADAAALMQLKQWQGVERPLAAAQVALNLNEFGYRDDDGDRLDGKSVVVWRNKMKRPDDPACLAAARYNSILAELKARFSEDHQSAYRFYLNVMPDLDMPSIPSKSSV